MPWKQLLLIIGASIWLMAATIPSPVMAGEDCQIEQPGIPPCEGCNPEQCCVCYAIGSPDTHCVACGGGWYKGTYEYECGGPSCWWNPPNVFQPRACGFCIP
jgi:hypothetical protein